MLSKKLWLQQSRKRDLSYDEDCFLHYVSSRMWRLKCQEAKICRQGDWKLKFQHGLGHYASRFCPRQVKLQQSRKRDLSCVDDWFWHRSGSTMLFWQGFACGECNDTTFLRSIYQNVTVTNIFHKLQSTSKIGFTYPMLKALLLSLSQLLLVVKLAVFANRGFVHAMRIVRSFSAMPQYQFFLYCSFRLWKDCCISFDHLNSGFTVEWVPVQRRSTLQRTVLQQHKVEESAKKLKGGNLSTWEYGCRLNAPERLKDDLELAAKA